MLFTVIRYNTGPSITETGLFHTTATCFDINANMVDLIVSILGKFRKISKRFRESEKLTMVGYLNLVVCLIIASNNCCEFRSKL